MKKSNKDLIPLQELIRKIHNIMAPTSYGETLEKLKSVSPLSLFKEYPKCLIPWKIGSQLLHLPICNRLGSVDPQMIQFSKKLVNRLKSVSPQDDSGNTIIITKLDKLFDKYSKDVPKPYDRAARIGQITKFTNRIINNLKGHLQ